MATKKKTVKKATKKATKKAVKKTKPSELYKYDADFKRFMENKKENEQNARLSAQIYVDHFELPTNPEVLQLLRERIDGVLETGDDARDGASKLWQNYTEFQDLASEYIKITDGPNEAVTECEFSVAAKIDVGFDDDLDSVFGISAFKIENGDDISTVDDQIYECNDFLDIEKDCDDFVQWAKAFADDYRIDYAELLAALEKERQSLTTKERS